MCFARRLARRDKRGRHRFPERASFRDRLPTAVAGQQFLRPPGQRAPDLPPFSLDPGNRHAVVAGGLVAQPGDHGGFGTLLDGDAPRPGDGPAADRRGMIGDGTGQAVGVAGVEGQELQHRPVEVLDVLGLRLLTAAASFFLA